MYRLPTSVDVSPGCAHRLPELMAATGASRPLILTDAGVRNTEWFDPLVKACGSPQIGDGISANPRAEEIDRLADIARSADVDFELASD